MSKKLKSLKVIDGQCADCLLDNLLIDDTDCFEIFKVLVGYGCESEGDCPTRTILISNVCKKHESDFE